MCFLKAGPFTQFLEGSEGKKLSLAVFSQGSGMNDPPRKKKTIRNDAADSLDFCPKVSHNGHLSDKRIIEFVKLLARHAAESDYAQSAPHSDQGGNDHDSTYLHLCSLFK